LLAIQISDALSLRNDHAFEALKIHQMEVNTRSLATSLQKIVFPAVQENMTTRNYTYVPGKEAYHIDVDTKYKHLMLY
jgi:hypothetical protein